MAFNGASSSSSSSSSFSSTHDVFLSFRGEDTRNNFTAHLYEALSQNGINTYIDDNLERGENISPALINAIKESRISVIVLSQNYASSLWCLDELATILECKETKGQIALPVFYKVEPSEVRYQKKSFEEAFAEHEEKFKDDQMKVQRWKTALTKVANLSGYHLRNRKEPEFIQEIIKRVNSILLKEKKVQVAQYPVGIERQVQAVKLLLEKKDNTCMVGIFGIGGIGKTTLAKAIFNLIASQFEDSCFLRDIRETSCQKDGLIHLQKKLLSKILGGSSPMIDDDDQGVTLIEERFRRKRILLVLDDVDQSVQLEKLAGKTDWFGLGSKIIITTRDKHLLHDRVDSAYEVKLLDHHEALQLFNWNAFKCDKPNVGYEEVTEDAVSYCGGLPLALTVRGSALKERDIVYWKSKLDEYKRTPDKKIQEILRISYDGLDDREKDIFLDIACFFKGQILEECPFFPYHGIEVLVNKSLISISSFERRLIMHDLLQEVGREIVRKESPEPGKRSRLWFHEDVLHVLEDNTGTNKVEGILIDFPEPDLIHLSHKAFKKMKRLRLIIIHSAHFSEQPTFLSNELRLIDWPKYPGKSFPSNFRGKNLIVLRMPHSHLREFKAVQNFQNVTTMNFSGCKFLREIPDYSRISNLETLYLSSCKNLVKVHRSVGCLDKLVDLNLCGCTNLRSFPRSLKLKFLERLNLDSCYKLKNFPEIECQMEFIEYVNFEETSIKEVPSSIQNLVGVEQLYLTNCKNLKNLPNSIGHLQYLRSLSLYGCTGLKELPSSFGYLVMLERLILDKCTNLLHLPNGFYQLQNLVTIGMANCEQIQEISRIPPSLKYMLADGCKSLAIFLEEARRPQLFNTQGPPEPVGFGMCLKELDLSGSDIVTLPRCIESFVGLWNLTLKNCKQLREVPKLPPSMVSLSFGGCTSLERFQFNDIYDLPKLQWIDLSDCPKQIHLLSEGHPKEHRFDCIFPGNKIPNYFSHREKVSNTNSPEIDVNEPIHLDLKITRFAFFAVIGKGDVQDEAPFQISVQVIINGQEIYFHGSFDMLNFAGSDHVWLHYNGSHPNRLKTGNLLVKFKCKDIYGKHPKSVFFKSCGFHLEHRYEEKAIDSMDGIQHSKRRRDGDDDDDGNLESNRYPQPKRGNLESQLHQSNHPPHLQPPFHVFLEVPHNAC